MAYYASKYTKALVLQRAGVKRGDIGKMLGISPHKVDQWVKKGELMIGADRYCLELRNSNPLYPFVPHDKPLLYALAAPDQDWLQFLAGEE